MLSTYGKISAKRRKWLLNRILGCAEDFLTPTQLQEFSAVASGADRWPYNAAEFSDPKPVSISVSRLVRTLPTAVRRPRRELQTLGGLREAIRWELSYLEGAADELDWMEAYDDEIMERVIDTDGRLEFRFHPRPGEDLREETQR